MTARALCWPRSRGRSLTRGSLRAPGGGAMFGMWLALDAPARVRSLVTIGTPAVALGARLDGLRMLARPGIGSFMLSMPKPAPMYRRTLVTCRLVPIRSLRSFRNDVEAMANEHVQAAHVRLSPRPARRDPAEPCTSAPLGMTSCACWWTTTNGTTDVCNRSAVRSCPSLPGSVRCRTCRKARLWERGICKRGARI